MRLRFADTLPAVQINIWHTGSHRATHLYTEPHSGQDALHCTGILYTSLPCILWMFRNVRKV